MFKKLAVLTVFIMLTGCGGGGGDTSTTQAANSASGVPAQVWRVHSTSAIKSLYLEVSAIETSKFTYFSPYFTSSAQYYWREPYTGSLGFHSDFQGWRVVFISQSGQQSINDMPLFQMDRSTSVTIASAYDFSDRAIPLGEVTVSMWD